MQRILVIAPHKDDELIGLGGTLLKYISKGDEVYICVVTRGYPPMWTEEETQAGKKEAYSCHEFMGVKKTYMLDFPAVLLEKEDKYKINDRLCEVVAEVKPDVVFIPHYGDMQKDHQIVAESSMVALRPKYKHVVRKIYGYETLSETGWNIPNIQNEFIPNTFVDISDFLEKKLECMKYYKSQLGAFPNARSLEAIEHLAKYRGAVMNMMAAEAFMLIRELK